MDPGDAGGGQRRRPVGRSAVPAAGEPDGVGPDGRSLGKVTYLTSFGAFGRDAYAYVAKGKGYFAEAGFDLDIKPGAGTGDNIKVIVGGRAQFTPIDLTGGLLTAGRAPGRSPGFTAVAGAIPAGLTPEQAIDFSLPPTA